jgi:uncharacterized protein (TIGR02301 family)
MRSLRLRFVPSAILVLLLLVTQMDVADAQNAPQQPSQGAPTSSAPAGDAEAKPYDQQVFQLAELLGAVHYLRELCGGDDGQTWRNQMRELVSAEGTTALRRARLVDSFNKGYRGYARTYRSCTKPALQAIERFMEQGASIADGMIQSNR